MAYGVNWVTIFGKVITEPKHVTAFSSSQGYGFLVDGGCNHVPIAPFKGLRLWCFSFDNFGQDISSYALEVGDVVVMHGSLFSPTAALMDQVGDKWSLCLDGHIVAVLGGGTFRRSLGQHGTAMAVMTGRVQPPGRLEYTGSSGKPYVQFRIKHECDIYQSGGWRHRQGQLKCCYNILDGSESVIIPGNVLLCRGELQNWDRFVVMWCSQVEAIGKVVNDNLARDRWRKDNEAKPGEFVSRRKPRWRAAARAKMLAEKRAEKDRIKLEKKNEKHTSLVSRIDGINRGGSVEGS